MHDSKFYVVDLFAGCGGLSEGFTMAGFDVIAQIEMDRWACSTLRARHVFYALKKAGKLNLYHQLLRGEQIRTDIMCKYPDLEQAISTRVIQATFGKEQGQTILKSIESSMNYHDATQFHVLLGGPPCQPYSLAGRSRDPDRMEKDKRHYLYTHYLEMLQQLQPDFFVYENVPGLFSAKVDGERILKQIMDDFSMLEPPYAITPPFEQIYNDPCRYILDSADFHIPQRRKRLILIGYKKSLEHKNPKIKDIFAKLQRQALRNRKLGHLTIDDAIGDLPPIKPGEGNDSWYGPYPDTSVLKNYQIRMREDSDGIINHRSRTHMSSDLERYKFFIEHHKNGNGAATLYDLIDDRPDLIPNHKHLDKFLDRFRVQWWNRPSTTITSHICKDGHYYIHPDISQCRSFTVREAARCQSFPDNYKFEGPRTEQFRQVGNAVPPLLAKTIAKGILSELRIVYEK